MERNWYFLFRICFSRTNINNVLSDIFATFRSQTNFLPLLCWALTFSVLCTYWRSENLVVFIIEYKRSTLTKLAAIHQPVYRFATGWTVWESNTGGGEIFRNILDRTWSPLNLQYRVPFPEVKRQGRGVYHSPRSSTEVKERVEPTSTPLLGFRELL